MSRGFEETVANSPVTTAAALDCSASERLRASSAKVKWWAQADCMLAIPFTRRLPSPTTRQPSKSASSWSERLMDCVRLQYQHGAAPVLANRARPRPCRRLPVAVLVGVGSDHSDLHRKLVDRVPQRLVLIQRWFPRGPRLPAAVHP